MDKPIRNDQAYIQACDEAKDDYFMLGIRRTQKQVDAHAQRIREEAERAKVIINQRA